LKKKIKKEKRLNLCEIESERVECYSPNKVVDIKEYLRTKEAVKATKVKAQRRREDTENC
jgi:hypothetical protein